MFAHARSRKALDRFHERISKARALVAAFLILPALAYAQNQNGQGDSLQTQVNALKATVAALQTQVNALQTQLTAVQSNNALKLGPFVSVNPNGTGLDKGVTGPNIYFTGANIHIESGLGATDDNLSTGGSLSGLGNLIIGYDETGKLNGNRGGSHNLVIGRFHTFTSSAFGGLVAGEDNTASGQVASVTGGNANRATGLGTWFAAASATPLAAVCPPSPAAPPHRERG